MENDNVNRTGHTDSGGAFSVESKGKSRFTKASDLDLLSGDDLPAQPSQNTPPAEPRLTLEVMNTYPDGADGTTPETDQPRKTSEAPRDSKPESAEEDPILNFTNYKKQKRRKKHRVLILLIVILLLALLLVGGLILFKYLDVIGGDDREERKSDGKDEYFSWTYDNGVLTVSGKGAMPDYESEYVPWNEYRGDITKVVIEKGITNIGNCTFRYCDSLTEVVVPHGIKRIGDRAFVDCDSLVSVTIPDSVTNIGAWAFDKCDSLTEVTLSDSLTTLGTGAFNECGNLESIEIPDNIRDIGQDAFNKCNKLTEVHIPEGIEHIGLYAFYCEALTDIYFGGTREEWERFDRPHNPEYSTVHCSDGDVQF